MNDTNWYVVSTREALLEALPAATEVGPAPYLLVVTRDQGVIVFDFQAMTEMLGGYNDAVLRIIGTQQSGDDAQG